MNEVVFIQVSHYLRPCLGLQHCEASPAPPAFLCTLLSIVSFSTSNAMAFEQRKPLLADEDEVFDIPSSDPPPYHSQPLQAEPPSRTRAMIQNQPSLQDELKALAWELRAAMRLAKALLWTGILFTVAMFPFAATIVVQQLSIHNINLIGNGWSTAEYLFFHLIFVIPAPRQLYMFMGNPEGDIVDSDHDQPHTPRSYSRIMFNYSRQFAFAGNVLVILRWWTSTPWVTPEHIRFEQNGTDRIHLRSSYEEALIFAFVGVLVTFMLAMKL